MNTESPFAFVSEAYSSSVISVLMRLSISFIVRLDRCVAGRPGRTIRVRNELRTSRFFDLPNAMNLSNL